MIGTFKFTRSTFWTIEMKTVLSSYKRAHVPQINLNIIQNTRAYFSDYYSILSYFYCNCNIHNDRVYARCMPWPGHISKILKIAHLLFRLWRSIEIHFQIHFQREIERKKQKWRALHLASFWWIFSLFIPTKCHILISNKNERKRKTIQLTKLQRV